MARMKPTLDLVFFDAGGGHRAAAQALRDMLAAQQRPWMVRLVNLTEVLDPAGRFRQATGMAPEDLYNRRLRSGWTLGMTQELKLLQAGIRFAHRSLLRRLSLHWQATAPDLVVSLIPNFNRALGESLARARPGAPFVTVLTDMADLPPDFWIVPGLAQHLVCGTSFAVQQALSAGHPAERISQVSGMLLRPAFYQLPALDRAAARRAAGLDPDRPTAVVMFGGQGSALMVRIARALPGLQLILLTGHNLALAARLSRQSDCAPRAVVGYTSDVPHWLRLADFFIGKPGPGSLSEALHLGLPVITFDNAWTMPQERFNARWVSERGLGRVLRQLSELPAAAADLVAQLPAWRARVGQLDNRAIYEVPDLLADLLAAAPARPVAAPALLAERSPELSCVGLS
jgi:hypothetical protein